MRIKRLTFALPILVILPFCVCAQSALQKRTASKQAKDLENLFRHPATNQKPYVWWHWMGPNFSKEGITKDLEAMKEMGLGGATIFNIASAVQETHFPILNNPWPAQTYRSSAYWEAIRHAAAEADRLGLEVGLHNTAGYSTTGGPWVTEEKAMQRTVVSKTKVEGGTMIRIALPKAEPPIFNGWGSPKIKASYYKDVAVLAIPEKQLLSDKDIIDVSDRMDSSGILTWNAPPGTWTIYRYGFAPTMANPHPLPDDIIGKSLEVDKMSAEHNRFHWKNVLDPLQQYVGPYLGKSFKHLLIDSYEADFQNWTADFRKAFIQLKGYDPVPWMPVFEKDVQGKDIVINNADQTARFKWDFKEVVNRLFFDNGWKIGKTMMQPLGLKVQFEPYYGPFDVSEGAAMADLPMGEFWTSRGGIQSEIPPAARAAGKTVIGAEAYTGRPELSQYTEDPAFLMPTTIQAFAVGVNRMILHTWVHQPFDDRYQPGMSMGWWGTHFGRHQTWAKQGKSFFEFLARAQTLLQYGESSSDYLCLGKHNGSRTDVISLHDFLVQDIRVVKGRIVLPSGRTYPLLYLPNSTAIQPEVLEKIRTLVLQGAIVSGAKPLASNSLKDYPRCDQRVRQLASTLWRTQGANQLGDGFVYPDLNQALEKIRLVPPVRVEAADSIHKIATLHRIGKQGDVFFIGNLHSKPQFTTLSFSISGKQPELWQAETGSISNAPVWRTANGRTYVQLFLEGHQSVFVVFRKPFASPSSHTAQLHVSGESSLLQLAGDASGKPILVGSGAASVQLQQPGKTSSISFAQPQNIKLEGPWNLSFQPKLDKPFDTSFSELSDFAKVNSNRIRYFAGTVLYTKTFRIPVEHAVQKKRIFLDLGELHDIVSLKINGRSQGTDWYPPYQFDITDQVVSGENKLEIEVTNNWANRLIGDEQEPADFEWGADRDDKGRAMKAFPDWFVRNQPRPSTGRKAFVLWYYYRKDSKLKPAGLIGPVQLQLREFVTL